MVKLSSAYVTLGKVFFVDCGTFDDDVGESSLEGSESSARSLTP